MFVTKTTLFAACVAVILVTACAGDNPRVQREVDTLKGYGDVALEKARQAGEEISDGAADLIDRVKDP